MEKLWYEEPAKIWEEALPLGNGRLGAMVSGNVINESIGVNEESIWYGGPMDRNNEDAKEALPKVRKLIFEGKIAEAESLLATSFTGTPEAMRPYQSLGSIELRFKDLYEPRNYYRELDLEDAVYKQNFTVEDTRFVRMMLISRPDDAMVMYFKTEGVVKVSLNAFLRRDRFFDGVKKSGENGIYLYGNLGKGGFDFGMSLSAKTVGGTVKVVGEQIEIEDATEVMLIFTAASTYRLGEGADIEAHNREIIKKVEAKTFSMIVKDHIEDYQNLFNRVTFEIGEWTSASALPTNERVKRVMQGKRGDISLSKLFFDYGRYLLISCSRPGDLPANLQGIWNKDMTPPWDSKYTVNINAQMNYWPAEVCNLSECHEPLLEFIKKLVPNGRKTAKEMYGCRGFVCHHNTDIYGDTAPQDMYIPASYWVMGAAWLCTHIWTHYEYTLDEEFLKEYFPIMREAAEFFLDYLVEHKGYLVTCPSVSPENTFILPNGQTGSNIYGVTMDNQILRDLFTQCIESAKILNVEDELNEQIKKALKAIKPTEIGLNGYILEWPEDYEEAEPGHRHISHLYGLYPSDQISVDKTPDLARAAKLTLERRLAKGGGHTGWSRAWIINHYAKLWEGEKAYDNLVKLFEMSVYPNLFDKHPPFQIDGNFGVTAGIANMIVQSDFDRIVLLPACPKAWKEGSMTGLKTKKTGTIDIYWENNKLTEAYLSFEKDIDMGIRYKDICQDMHFEANKTYLITLANASTLDISEYVEEDDANES